MTLEVTVNWKSIHFQGEYFMENSKTKFLMVYIKQKHMNITFMFR